MFMYCDLREMFDEVTHKYYLASKNSGKNAFLK